MTSEMASSACRNDIVKRAWRGMAAWRQKRKNGVRMSNGKVRKKKKLKGKSEQNLKARSENARLKYSSQILLFIG